MKPAPRRVKVWRPQGFAGLEVEVFENVADYAEPKNVLDEYHFNVTFRGRARVFYGGTRHAFRYDRPLVMVQQPGEVYAMDARGEALSGWNLCLYEGGMRSVMEAFELPGSPRFPEMLVPGALNEPLAAELRGAVQAFDLPATRLERESKLLGVVRAFLGARAERPLQERPPGREHRAVRQARDALHAHFTDEVSVETLASLAGLSQGYLLRTFKAEVGVTPHAYQIALRIDRAKDLLASGVDIAHVAAETGFVDQSHLTRTFKRHVQTTPGRFQRDSSDVRPGAEVRRAL